MTDMRSCPKCGANWQGGEIPVESRKMYGGASHFSRLIGIVENDMVARWQCPDCKAEFPRSRASAGFFRNCDVAKVVTH